MPLFDAGADRNGASPTRAAPRWPAVLADRQAAHMDALVADSIKPNSGDPHAESLWHLALAINKESEMLASSGNFLSAMVPSLGVKPLGWLGSSVALYADEESFWKQLEQSDEAETFLKTNYHRLPVAIIPEPAWSTRGATCISRATVVRPAMGIPAR